MKTCTNIYCTCTDFNKEFCKWYSVPKKEKVKKVNTMSDKRKEEAREYSILRKKFLAACPTCEAKLKDCKKVASDVHHKAGRGKNFLNMATWLPVCRNCHEIIHKYPEFARMNGLMERKA